MTSTKHRTSKRVTTFLAICALTVVAAPRTIDARTIASIAFSGHTLDQSKQSSTPAPQTPEVDEVEKLLDDLCSGVSSFANYERAKELSARNIANHAISGRFLECSASWYLVQGDLSTSETFAQRAVDFFQGQGSAARDQVLEALQNLTLVQLYQGKTQSALGTVDQQLALVSDTSSAVKAYERGTVLSFASGIYLASGQLGKAEELGREHLALLFQYNAPPRSLIEAEKHLSGILMLSGKNLDARQFAQTAFELARIELSKNPLYYREFINASLALAKTYVVRGDASIALSILAALESDLSEDKASGRFPTEGIAADISEVRSEILFDAKEYQKSLDELNRYRAFGVNHPDSTQDNQSELLAIAQLGMRQVCTGDLENGTQNFEKGLQNEAATFVETAPIASIIYTRLSTCFLRYGDTGRAKKYSRLGVAGNRSLQDGMRRDGNISVGGAFDRETPAELTLLRALWTSSERKMTNEIFTAIQQLRPSSVEISFSQSSADSYSRSLNVAQLASEFRAAEQIAKVLDEDIAALTHALGQAESDRDELRQAVYRTAGGYLSLEEFPSDQRATYDRVRERIAQIGAQLQSKSSQRYDSQLQLASTQRRLDAAAPRYMSIRKSAPVSLGDLRYSDAQQGLLKEGQALIILTPGSMEMPEGHRKGFIFVFAPGQEPVWQELPIEAGEVAKEINALRNSLTGQGQTDTQSLRARSRFDRQRSFEFYQALFGNPKVGSILKNAKHWLIVPQGEFLAAPFSTLIMAQPEGGSRGDGEPNRLRATKWLGIEKSISILPSVSAFASKQSEPSLIQFDNRIKFFAFGNPSMADWRSALSQRSELTQSIPETRRREILGLPQIAASEIVALREHYSPQERRIFVQADATERKLRENENELGSADVVLFATHGLTGGSEGSFLEPSLLLGPPPINGDLGIVTQGRSLEGLLMASEISTLRLTANWVVLAACNTASGAYNQEGLSGLARAFFNAGARSLLVSQWRVDDSAAAFLVMNTIGGRTSNKLDKAELLKVQMTHLMNDTSADISGFSNAHPSKWAAFIYVGAE